MNRRLYIVLVMCVFTFPSLSCKKENKATDPSTDFQPQPVSEEKKNFKVISYNVYYGMREDASMSKQSFVDWISSQAPDVLAIQEANGFTSSSLKSMAEKYNHKYSELLSEKGFPVAITSKYPITNVKKVMTTNNQGYIHAIVQDYNIVILHLDASSRSVRNDQMQTILTNTVKAYPSRKKWLIMGDFNCVSPLDEQDLIGKSGSKEFDINQDLLDNYKFIDVVRHQHNQFIPSCRTEHFLELQGDPNWITRYDFIYASQDLNQQIAHSDIIRDSFTKRMSDHYPILLELKAK
jgi:exodeoxyribonuclease-3